MKLRCNDSEVRDFLICKDISGIGLGLYEAKCLKCGKKFGVHDTKILKPMFRNHICEKKKEASLNV